MGGKGLCWGYDGGIGFDLKETEIAVITASPKSMARHVDEATAGVRCLDCDGSPDVLDRPFWSKGRKSIYM